MSVRPDIGEWYSIRGGDQFEVVAVDEDDGTIEVQYFDGTVEELDMSDWQSQQADGEIEDVDPPDGWNGSADFDEDDGDCVRSSHFDHSSQMSGGLEGLDLFE